jgi:hypothetical protein
MVTGKRVTHPVPIQRDAANEWFPFDRGMNTLGGCE